MTKIAFLGLGAMGSRMAANLVKNGFDVTVWNRSPGPSDDLAAAGAVAATTPREAVADADVVITCLRDDAASKAVWLDPETGALAGMKPDAVAVESSTITVDWAKQLAAAVTADGKRFLEAPVSGSLPQAEAGELVHICGGEAATLDAVRPVLDAHGSAQHLVGPAGAGALIKLAVNSFLAIQQAALAEVLAMAKRGGVEPDVAVGVITTTPACSPLAKMTAEAMAARNFTPLFPISLMAKDLGYAMAAAGGGDMPLTAGAQEVFENAVAAGFGEDNTSGVVQLYIPDD